MKYILLLFICTSIHAETNWVQKREIGGVRIWKHINSKFKDVRATSQIFKGPSKLFMLENKLDVLKEVEKVKSKALENFGITQWSAKNYKVDKGKSILIKGTYLNRDKVTVYFIEKHIFNGRERIVITLNRESSKEIPDEFIQSMETEVTNNWSD